MANFGVWLVRHGQSVGNVAADLADNEGAASVVVDERDAEVPLSALGERQARALGRWFGRLAPLDRPTAIVMSPWLRARRTAALIAEEAKATFDCCADERLRERDLGTFDRLTRRGWTERHPEQAALRDRLGKFYHRPPGGENWCDVILRVRTLIQDLHARRWGERILIVTHHVVVLSLRYVVETMDEASLMRIDADMGVPNCAVTSYASVQPGAFQLTLENYVEPIDGAGEAVTASRDRRVAPR